MRYHVQPDLKDAAKRTIQIGLSLSRGRMAQHTRLSEKGKGRPGWTASRSVVTYTTDLFRHNWPDHYQSPRPVTLSEQDDLLAVMDKKYKRVFSGEWSRFAWGNFVTLTGDQLFDTIRQAIENFYKLPGLSNTG